MGLALSQPKVIDGERAYSKFLKKFRETHTYLSESEVDKNALMTWNSMTPEQKSKFLKCGRSSTRQMRNRLKMRTKAKPNRTATTIARNTKRIPNGTNARARAVYFSKGRNNAFRNFLQEFRRKNKGLDAETAIKLGAKAWCLLYEEEKLALDELLT